MFERRLLLPLTALLVALPASSSTVPTPGTAGAEAPPTEASLFYDPTPPIALLNMVPESEPVASLVVAAPEEQVLGNPDKERLLAQLIDVASRYVKVFVLVNEDERSAPESVRGLIRRYAGQPDRVMASLAFVRAEIDTEWVRDYGPVFGLGGDDEPVLIDNMYRDIGREADTQRLLQSRTFIRIEPDADGGRTYPSDYGHFWRRRDDAAPRYFNEILYLNHRRFAPLVRSPLLLPGGDAVFTYDRRLLTSTRSLQINGGDDRRFQRLAHEYLGVDAVEYLRPLPDGMWHLDMVLKIAGPGVIMMGEFQSAAAHGVAVDASASQHEAAETLRWNRRLVESRFPGIEVIPVPMPAVPAPAAGGPSAVAYRSYLNSVVLNTTHGSSAVIVPRFKGHEALETQVKAAYLRAFPEAQVHFLDSDVLVDDFAGLHCVTITVPAFSSTGPRRPEGPEPRR